MRKLVLGIAAVIVLDVGFIWMVNEQSYVPEMALDVIPNVRKPLVSKRRPVKPVAVADSEAPDDLDTVTSAVSDRPDASSNSTPVSARVPKVKTAEVRTPTLDGKQLFPDMIIYYGKYEAPETSEPAMDISPVKNSGSTEVPVAEPPLKAKKRSFKSRAFGVIKKPFNAIKKPFKWIGSVASKIGH